jgi:hypothetical protein
MAELLILEFEGIGKDEYDAVNGKLGLDSATGEGDWPAGLLVHTAGTAEGGTFVVSEVWSSREAQADFMQTRLGEALAAGGVTGQPTVRWIPLVALQNLDG